MSQVSSTNDTNTALCTAGGAAAGAIVSGALGYISKPWLKNGDISDKFVKSLEAKIKQSGMDETYRNGIREYMKASKDANMFVYLGTLTDASFLPENIANTKQGMINIIKRELGDNAEVLNRFDELVISKITNSKQAKEVAAVIYDTTRRNLISDYFTKDGKLNTELIEDWLGNIVKKTTKSMKIKRAALCGSIGAAVAGVLAWVFTHTPKENALEKLKKEVTTVDKTKK